MLICILLFKCGWRVCLMLDWNSSVVLRCPIEHWVKASSGFASYMQDKPLTLAQGGSHAVLVDTEVEAAVKAKRKITGLACFGHINCLYCANPGVAIRQSALVDVIASRYPDGPPSDNTMPFTITVPIGDDHWQPFGAKVSWPHLNAEFIIATVQATYTGPSRCSNCLVQLNS